MRHKKMFGPFFAHDSRLSLGSQEVKRSRHFIALRSKVCYTYTSTSKVPLFFATQNCCQFLGALPFPLKPWQ